MPRGWEGPSPGDAQDDGGSVCSSGEASGGRAAVLQGAAAEGRAASDHGDDDGDDGTAIQDRDTSWDNLQGPNILPGARQLSRRRSKSD